MKIKSGLILLTFTWTSLIFGACSNELETDTTKNESVEVVKVEDENVTNLVETEEMEIVNETEEVINEKETTFEGYKLIEVGGGDLSGTRQSNVVVDIGYGDREYYAYTNEYGQLVKVTAAKIILQNDETEDVTSSGRYYSDEAKVPGVESEYLDEGHIIADSLGGVSNAYNITPQESTLNRHGDQAYMEEVIRKAGGATNFEAIITYPDNETQIPSHYQYTYTINGNVIEDSFDNVNPDEVNAAQGLTTSEPVVESPTVATPAPTTSTNDVSSVDTNGNGQVTISEAKAAGFSMPITSDHWLYQYMDDRDGDGMVGE